MPPQPSAQQEAIYDHVGKSRRNLIISARAGTGKTTTLIEALGRLPKGQFALFLAFNREIVKELTQRVKGLGAFVSVATCHSFGLRCVKEAYGRDVQLDGLVPYKMAERLTSDRDERKAIVKALSFAKAHLAKSADDVAAVIDDFGLNTNGDFWRFVNQVYWLLKASRERDSKVITFDDQIWLPVDRELRIPKFDVVLVDEFQDLTPAQTELAYRALKKRGKMIVVGDEKQAIYGWRGAGTDNMQTARQKLEADLLPLTTTWRCGKAIVAEAQKFVPDIVAPENAHQGAVVTLQTSDLLNLAEKGDFVLSRTNAPLVSLAFRLIKAGKKVTILGRDLAKGLETLIKRQKARSTYELSHKMVNWAEKEKARLLALDPPAERAAELAEDKARCVVSLCGFCSSVNDVVEKLTTLFDDKAEAGDVITLSTTHKAKGLERDRVWLLRDTYLKARRGRISQEEKNLYYVAVTRAKNELVIVRGEGEE